MTRLSTIVAALIAASAFAGCAASVRTPAPTTPSPRYELCNDPSFECVPAPASEHPVLIDTNATTPAHTPAMG